MYSIISFKALPNGLITDINWCYTNSEGSVRSNLSLAAPSSEDSLIPIDNILPENLIDFVKASIENTAEVLDLKIREFQTEQEYENSLVTYVIDENGSIAKL